MPAGTHGPRATKKHAAEPQVQPEQPAFPAQWFYGLYVLSSVNRAFLQPSSADRSAHLAPASGRQDHTTSPSAIRHSSCDISRPSHPALNVRDDRETPLCVRRDTGMIVLIWGLRQYPSGCGTLARRANGPRRHCEPPGRAGAGVEGGVRSPSPTKAVPILPLPVFYGERVGVRGFLQKHGTWKVPLTPTLSPQAGRGRMSTARAAGTAKTRRSAT